MSPSPVRSPTSPLTRDPRVLPGGWILPEDRDAVLAARAARSMVPPAESPTTVLTGSLTEVPTRLPAASPTQSPLPTEVPAAPPSASGAVPRIGVRRPAMVAIGACFLVLVTGAGPTFGDSPKTVTLSVDGEQRIVATDGGSVRDALLAAGVAAGPRDLVAPALDAPVQDGAHVTVRRARLVTLEVDGRSRQWWTTATTVDQALLEMGVRAADYRLSASRSREIGPAGTTIVGEPLRWVSVVDGRHAATRTRTAAGTVRELLAAQRITVGRYDRVTPAQDTALHNGERVTITRVQRSARVEHRSVAQPAAVVEHDATLGKGNTVVVTTGHPGQRTVVVDRVVTNGSPVEKVRSDTLTKRPAPAVTKVGTKETGLPESWSVPWDKMAFCESTSRWSVNTGNGTYGGLQFKTPTWLEYGGGDFAPRADLATEEQQIIIAERLYAVEGLAPWHCARLLGWGFGKYEG